jgi:predicted nucleic acid binding AN1-type Zn finger protein
MVFKLPRNMKTSMLLSTLPPAISSNLMSTQLQYCRWLTVADDMCWLCCEDLNICTALWRQFSDMHRRVQWHAPDSSVTCTGQFSDMHRTVQWHAPDSSVTCTGQFSDVHRTVQWHAPESSVTCTGEFSDVHRTVLWRAPDSSATYWTVQWHAPDSSVTCTGQFSDTHRTVQWHVLDGFKFYAVIMNKIFSKYQNYWWF